jgi:hypothetical protein
MKLERRGRERAGLPVGALVGGAFAIGGALTAVWLHLGLPRPVCLLREWTGVPCPTCGTTRLIEALLSGDLLGAVAWNPLVFLVLTAAAVWAVLSAASFAFRLPTWRVAFSRRERTWARILAIAALVGGWAWVLWHSG